MEWLEKITGQDAYATPYFFGIIYGNELVCIKDPDEFKELVLKRLREAYEKAVEQVNFMKNQSKFS